jgi:hypothetical protein
MKESKIVRSKCSKCSGTLKHTVIQLIRVEHFCLNIKFQMFQMFRFGQKRNKRNKAEHLKNGLFHPLCAYNRACCDPEKGVEQMERNFASR